MRRKNEMNDGMLEQVNGGEIVAEIGKEEIWLFVWDGSREYGRFFAKKDSFVDVSLALELARTCAVNNGVDRTLIQLDYYPETDPDVMYLLDTNFLHQ